MGVDLTKFRFELMTFDSNTMLNYQFSYKVKLIGRNKFNHLIITLTYSSPKKKKNLSLSNHLREKKKKKKTFLTELEDHENI
jgi:hypothetical protein